MVDGCYCRKPEPQILCRNCKKLKGEHIQYKGIEMILWCNENLGDNSVFEPAPKSAPQAEKKVKGEEMKIEEIRTTEIEEDMNYELLEEKYFD